MCLWKAMMIASSPTESTVDRTAAAFNGVARALSRRRDPSFSSVDSSGGKAEVPVLVEDMPSGS